MESILQVWENKQYCSLNAHLHVPIYPDMIYFVLIIEITLSVSSTETFLNVFCTQQANLFQLTPYLSISKVIHVILTRRARKQHRRVTISRWPGMLRSIGAQTPQGLPAVDYGVGSEAEWNSEWSQLDKERPANYAQVKYTCCRAPILKLTLSVIRQAEVTTVLQWFTPDWNALRLMTCSSM